MAMRKSFDEWALDIARDVAGRSTCKRRSTGAIAVDMHGRIVGVGYNGQPRGFHTDLEFRHCVDDPCPGSQDPSGDSSRCEAIHSEENMIINSRDPYSISTAYLTTSPCFHCALLLANLPNLKRVVYIDEYTDKGGLDVLGRSEIRTEWWQGLEPGGKPVRADGMSFLYKDLRTGKLLGFKDLDEMMGHVRGSIARMVEAKVDVGRLEFELRLAPEE